MKNFACMALLLAAPCSLLAENAVGVPEINGQIAGSGLMLIGGALLILRARRKS